MASIWLTQNFASLFIGFGPPPPEIRDAAEELDLVIREVHGVVGFYNFRPLNSKKVCCLE